MIDHNNRSKNGYNVMKAHSTSHSHIKILDLKNHKTYAKNVKISFGTTSYLTLLNIKVIFKQILATLVFSKPSLLKF
jgi:hypothetical protein